MAFNEEDIVFLYAMIGSPNPKTIQLTYDQ